MITSQQREAWDQLTTRLRGFVGKRIRLAADRDDVVQDILLRMWNGLPGLRQDEHFGPWVYQIARRAIADYWRRRKPEAAVQDPVAEEAVDDDAAEAASRRLAPYLAALVGELPSPYREAITLTELDGLTQKEAAAVAGISLPGMKSRVQRGRELLRRMLLACCEIELSPSRQVIGCTPRRRNSSPDDCCPD